MNEQQAMDEALQCFRKKEYEEAIILLKQVIKENKQHAEAYAWLAACYGKRMQQSDVLQKLRLSTLSTLAISKAMHLDAQLPLTYRVRGFKYLYTPELFGGDVYKAIEDFQYCLKHGDASADVYFGLGVAYLKLDHNKLAVKHLRAALELDPSNGEARQLLAGIAG